MNTVSEIEAGAKQRMEKALGDLQQAMAAIRTVPWPKISGKAALIKIGACGVCGTDLHILKGHWPKKLPWPFTLGHELGGALVEVGSEFKADFMEKLVFARESPAFRIFASGIATTCSGDGERRPGNSAMKRLRIASAALPASC